jgi:hypothetical protein
MRGVQKCTCAGASLRGRNSAPLCCIKLDTATDPACGSGSLLLKAAKILGKDNVRQGFYGQELNSITYNLCRINMILHDIDHDKFDIRHGDTLMSPLHCNNLPFEVIVTNPPFSLRWDIDQNPQLRKDPRFSPAGVLAPKSKSDLAFVMHALSCLATDGVAAVICAPGVMYRDGAEQKIRKYLIDNNFIDCIIMLPENLFFGTDISTCVMVLKKNKPDSSVLFVDASDQYTKTAIGEKNKLADDNIQAILNAFVSRSKVSGFTNVVQQTEIAAHNYSLSVRSYVKQEHLRKTADLATFKESVQHMIALEKAFSDKIASAIAKNDAAVLAAPEDMIRALPPDCVTDTELKNILTLHNGRSYKGLGDGKIPVYGSGGIIAYVDTPNCVGPAIIIPRKGSIDKLYYVEDPFWSSDTTFYGQVDTNLVIPKYVFYYLQGEHLEQYNEKGSVPTLHRTTLNNIKIRIPPIPVQEKIVQTLDGFAELTDMIAEHQTSLEEQYKDYRDTLWSFLG